MKETDPFYFSKMARDNLTDSEKVIEDPSGSVYRYSLVLHGKHVPGTTRLWFRSKDSRAEFAKPWIDQGYKVDIGYRADSKREGERED